mmetsp:Transcript_102687/g.258720  ORF Transcript_102687/g.258720 Transcript_102687/m.258720 type:complete len:244 (+) Transcript_102687:569-1300(+)
MAVLVALEERIPKIGAAVGPLLLVDPSLHGPPLILSHVDQLVGECGLDFLPEEDDRGEVLPRERVEDGLRGLPGELGAAAVAHAAGGVDHDDDILRPRGGCGIPRPEAGVVAVAGAPRGVGPLHVACGLLLGEVLIAHAAALGVGLLGRDLQVGVGDGLTQTRSDLSGTVARTPNTDIGQVYLHPPENVVNAVQARAHFAEVARGDTVPIRNRHVAFLNEAARGLEVALDEVDDLRGAVDAAQ